MASGGRAVHLHGHIHLYLPAQPREDCYRATRVINAYGFSEVTLDMGASKE